MYRKVVKPSNLKDTMSSAQGNTLQKYGFPCTLWAELGSHGIVVKCTAAIFFLTEDWIGLTGFNMPLLSHLSGTSLSFFKDSGV